MKRNFCAYLAQKERPSNSSSNQTRLLSAEAGAGWAVPRACRLFSPLHPDTERSHCHSGISPQAPEHARAHPRAAPGAQPPSAPCWNPPQSAEGPKPPDVQGKLVAAVLRVRCQLWALHTQSHTGYPQPEAGALSARGTTPVGPGEPESTQSATTSPPSPARSELPARFSPSSPGFHCPVCRPALTVLATWTKRRSPAPHSRGAH